MDGSGFGNPDRGWNDPPKLAFNPTVSGTSLGSGRHRLLNKRVPIPLNPQNTSSSSPLPPSSKGETGPPCKSSIPMHPPSVSAGPPPPSLSSLASAAATHHDGELRLSNSVSSQELLEQVETRLLGCLKSLSEEVKERTHEEIKKRLTVMAEMWQKDQLSPEVQKRMTALSKALSQQDYEKAWELHQGLIVDYTTACSPWMVGVKTLISESRINSEDTLNKDELQDSSNKNSEELNPVLDENKESSINNVPLEN